MIYINTTTVVALSDHRDDATGGAVTDATVTASVLDGPATLFSASLAHASGGTYRGVFTAEQTATLDPDRLYTLQLVAVSSGGTLTVRQSVTTGYA